MSKQHRESSRIGWEIKTSKNVTKTCSNSWERFSREEAHSRERRTTDSKKFHKTVSENMKKIEGHLLVSDNIKRGKRLFSNSSSKAPIEIGSRFLDSKRSFNDAPDKRRDLRLHNSGITYNDSNLVCPAYTGVGVLRFPDGRCCKKPVFFVPNDNFPDGDGIMRKTTKISIEPEESYHESTDAGIKTRPQRKLVLKKETCYFINGISVRPVLILSPQRTKQQVQRYSPPYHPLPVTKEPTAPIRQPADANDVCNIFSQDLLSPNGRSPLSVRFRARSFTESFSPRSDKLSSGINLFSCWKCLGIDADEESTSSLESESGSDGGIESINGGGSKNGFDYEDFNEIDEVEVFEYSSDGGGDSDDSSVSNDPSLYDEHMVAHDLFIDVHHDFDELNDELINQDLLHYDHSLHNQSVSEEEEEIR
ncbi:uncharacterized protein LOC143459813 isoform X2 [Clavelina lepadiformis]